MGETPSHSLWRQVSEDERAEMLPGLGWFGVKGRSHLMMGEVVEEEGFLDPVKEKAAEKTMGSHL